MGRLSLAFAAAAGVEPVEVGAELEDRLTSLHARGRAAHPQLELRDDLFAAHLGRCGALASSPREAVHVEDLYLACACLEGDEVAIKQLVDGNKATLVSTLRRIEPSADFVDEAVLKHGLGARVQTFVQEIARRIEAELNGSKAFERRTAVFKQRR